MIIKKLLFIALLLPVLNAFGQDTTYFNNEDAEVHSLANADYYEIVQHDSADTSKVTDKTYFKSGQIRSEKYYTEDTSGLENGEMKAYYKNGQLRQDIIYKNSKYDDVLSTYWENGKPRRIDHFRNGKFISGKCFTADGKATVHSDFEKIPEFPGGDNALIKYLRKKIKYPKKARKNSIQGDVRVSFIVNKSGNVTNVHITKGVNEDLNAEALKVVKEMPRWKPGTQDGEVVNVNFYLPIRFRLK